MLQETGKTPEKNSPTPHTLGESQKYLQNFQAEVIEELKKRNLDENGNLKPQSFRDTVGFLSELSNFNTVDIKSEKFSWLDAKEKEVLSQNIPAVKGIL